MNETTLTKMRQMKLFGMYGAFNEPLRTVKLTVIPWMSSLVI